MLTIQAKAPESLSKPIKTIIPTKKRITSREENSKTCSKSIVLVIRSTAVPIKAKLKRKSQKKSVPRIEAENIPMESDWCAFIPAKPADAPRENARRNRDSSLRKRPFIVK
jgi:hypothetical protein